MTKKPASAESPAEFRMTIHDVLDYDEWEATVGASLKWGPSLANICQSRLDELMQNRRLRGMRSGEVVFFLSQDRKRARTLLCLAKGVYSVGTVAFGKQSPELVMSLWLGDRLRAVGLDEMAAKVDAMTVEERHKAWVDLKRSLAEATKP